MCISSPFPDNKEMVGPLRLMGGHSRGPGSGLTAPSERRGVTGLVLPQSPRHGHCAHRPRAGLARWRGTSPRLCPTQTQHPYHRGQHGATLCIISCDPQTTPRRARTGRCWHVSPSSWAPPTLCLGPFWSDAPAEQGDGQHSGRRFQSYSHTTHLNKRKTK